MPRPHPATATVDPLEVFLEHRAGRTGRPLPLFHTAYDVVLDRGLAIVTVTRVFRNLEDESIEATLTFPVPVAATLFALEARVGERVLRGSAKRRQQARRDYEDGLARGKTAVLHEEVLRGVHMLSVGHVPPGEDVTVTLSFTMSLSFVAGVWTLRIPLTVGEIYGISPMIDADDLQSGGVRQRATLTVRAAQGAVQLGNEWLTSVPVDVWLDRPLELRVTDMGREPLVGRAADGRAVRLSIAPATQSDRALDVAILVDHSGSMGEACAVGGAPTKHGAVQQGLLRLVAGMSRNDRLDLWEFDGQVGHVGICDATGFNELVARLAPPSGGTEIGKALGDVLQQSPCRNVLLITDGKSHALDVQALARAGRRISVVLVGEDSLEANVGHLAALSGGELIAVLGSDPAPAIATAIAGLRRPFEHAPAIEGPVSHLRAIHGAAQIDADWLAETSAPADAPLSRAVAAFAAGLALPRLDKERAALLAEAEGLVTHLTSLILIDEAGESQQGIPAGRKISLPTPDLSAARSIDRQASVRASYEALSFDHRVGSFPEWQLQDRADRVERSSRIAADRTREGLAAIAVRIDWDGDPSALLRGDLSELPGDLRRAIENASLHPEIAKVATQHGLPPALVVLGLLARAASGISRSAARIAARLLETVPAGVEHDLALALTLGGASQ